jgi:hypothetical protein
VVCVQAPVCAHADGKSAEEFQVNHWSLRRAHPIRQHRTTVHPAHPSRPAAPVASLCRPSRSKPKPKPFPIRPPGMSRIGSDEPNFS